MSNPFRPPASLVYTTTAYDSLGRTKTVTTPDGAATQYACQNNRTTITDPAGKDRRTVTNGLGQLAQVYENPSGLNLLTTYSYNGANSLLVVNQSGVTRSFGYDWLQRLTSAHNPESGTVLYTSYDGNGNLLSKTDARGVTVTSTYNEMNQVLTRTYATGGTTAAATNDVYCTYSDPAVANSIGRLTKTREYIRRENGWTESPVTWWFATGC